MTTNQEKEKSTLEEENKLLKLQVEAMQDLSALKDESLYRRQMLMMLERIAQALENSLQETEEDNKK